MSYINRKFPQTSVSSWPGNSPKRQSGAPEFDKPYDTSPLQSPGVSIDINGIEEIFSGALTYLQFIELVKAVWESSHSTIPIFPSTVNRESMFIYDDDHTTVAVKNLASGPIDSNSGLQEYPAVILYALELRKPHTVEPKPRMRQNTVDNYYTIYGQKFQNIISFSVAVKAGTLQDDDPTTTSKDRDSAQLADQVIEAFEDFMMEFTPIFKAAGASELVYSRRLSDSEINRDGRDVHMRTVTYMLTTEKTFAIRNDRINSILIDVRRYMANQNTVTEPTLATPNYSNVDVNIVDLNQTATPNT